MLGANTLAAIYLGGILVTSSGVVESSEILSETLGKESRGSEIKSEVLGLGKCGIDYKIVIRNPYVRGGTCIPGCIPMCLGVTSSKIGEFSKFTNLTYSKNLNYYGECSFEIPIDCDEIDLVQLRRFEVEVYRINNGIDSLVWAGEMAHRRGRLTSDGDDFAKVTSYDWLEQLNSRYTDELRIYTQLDQGEIAWSLIDETQGQPFGRIGIRRGVIVQTISRDRTYKTANVMGSLINISQVISGSDFEITNDKTFNWIPIIGSDKTNQVILELGFNITNCEIEEDFVNPVNRAIVQGQSVDSIDPIRVDTNDSDLQRNYRLREKTSSEPDVSEEETLIDKGEALIRKQGLSLLKISVDLLPGSPSVSEFSLGDSIRLIIKKGMYNIDRNYRIFGYKVHFDDEGVERLDLILGDFTL